MEGQDCVLLDFTPQLLYGAHADLEPQSVFSITECSDKPAWRKEDLPWGASEQVSAGAC